MKKMARIAAAAILTLGASAVTTSTATAGLSNATITSDPATSRRHLGSFAGTASYDDATHKLTVHLNNTSASGRGFLTGFAFNTKGGAAKYLDGDNLATRADEDAFDNLKMARRTGKTKVKPFGEYEAGAGLDGKIGAARGARRGVAAGSGHTFVFDVTGADSNATVADLLGGNGLPLVANFRGFKRGKSDQVAARLQLMSESDATVTDPGTDVNGGGNGGTPIIAPPVNIIPSDGNTGGKDGSPTDGGSNVIPVIDDGGGQPNAVPLPPAALTGMGTMGLLAAGAFRRFGIRAGR